MSLHVLPRNRKDKKALPGKDYRDCVKYPIYLYVR